MKKLNTMLFVSLSFLFALDAGAQSQMKSPPASAKGTVDGVNIEINYSAPSARGRKIMGDLVPFDAVWRTGANNATTISFDKDVKIEGQPLSAGTYGLFTIPGEKEWTIIFNTVPKQLGSFNYEESKDALRVTVNPAKTDAMVETFKIEVVDQGVEMTWENTSVMFKVSK